MMTKQIIKKTAVGIIAIIFGAANIWNIYSEHIPNTDYITTSLSTAEYPTYGEPGTNKKQGTVLLTCSRAKESCLGVDLGYAYGVEINAHWYCSYTGTETKSGYVPDCVYGLDPYCKRGDCSYLWN